MSKKNPVDVVQQAANTIGESLSGVWDGNQGGWLAIMAELRGILPELRMQQEAMTWHRMMLAGLALGGAMAEPSYIGDAPDEVSRCCVEHADALLRALTSTTRQTTADADAE